MTFAHNHIRGMIRGGYRAAVERVKDKLALHALPTYNAIRRSDGMPD